MLFELLSGAALATVVGVLIEVPVMLMLVRVCQRTEGWFAVTAAGTASEERQPVASPYPSEHVPH